MSEKGSEVKRSVQNRSVQKRPEHNRSAQNRSKQKKSKYKSYKGEVGKVADNLLKRNFTAEKPFEKLTTDVTEFSVCNEKVYFSPVMDLYNREIISYSISKSPNFWQTREMLQGLFEKLPKGAKPLLHSDQGWQYQMREFQRMLAEHNIQQSMSRKGNCWECQEKCVSFWVRLNFHTSALGFGTWN